MKKIPINEEIEKLREYCQKEFLRHNNSLISEKSFINYKNRGNIYLRMLYFDNAESDFKQAIKSAEKKHFLSDKYYKEMGLAYFYIAKSRKSVFKVLHHFIEKEIIEEEYLIEMRNKIVSDLSISIDLYVNKNKFIQPLEKKYVFDMFYERGENYRRNGEYDLAISDFNKATEYIREDYQNRQIWKSLAIIYNSKRDSQKVKYYCDKISEKNSNIEIAEFLANLREKNNDIIGAIKEYTKGISIKGYTITNGTDFQFVENQRKGDFYVARGKLYGRLEETEKSFEDFIMAYKVDESILEKHSDLIENQDLKEYLKNNFYK